MDPLVSILIPCYNAERWIGLAIESALAQTWPEKEILVVDDGSTDKSLEVIESFGDRIRWETGPNRGGNAARNRLLDRARGEWLQYLDADDYLLPGKVARQVEFAREFPKADILYSPHTMSHRSPDWTVTEFTTVVDPCDIWVQLAQWSLPGTGAGIWRKRRISTVGGWDEQLPCCQEHELFLRLLMADTPFLFCPHGGYIYRHWSDGTVSKRNPVETHRRKLEIERRAEVFLRENGKLTSERLQAINQGRFETARMAWRYDPAFAVEIAETIRRSQPGFQPRGDSAPRRYRAIYNALGFRTAERVAEMLRRKPATALVRKTPTRQWPAAPLRNPEWTTGVRALVSILIPCYNAERWIAQAIESALGQTWQEKEVVVVDDGSTDKSLEIIKSFGDRIQWESGPNRGGNAARNRLLALSRGAWIQYLDADDYLLSDKVARQMEFLSVHRETDVVYGFVTMEYWSENGTRRELTPIPKPHDPWVMLARWYLPQTGAALWRKQTLLDLGGWKADQPCCQEHELYLRLLMAGKHFTLYPTGGAVYRQWGEHTVCKRDKPEVHRRRLAIEQRIEDFLRDGNELTPERLQAINQARFEIARLAWHYDQDFAAQIMKAARQSQPRFSPNGKAAPPLYRTLLKFVGFKTTEIIAGVRRPLRGERNQASP